MTMHITNRYILEQKIGSGGMGDVYRGIDKSTSDPVAIKVLKSELATTEMITRFRREGEALRQLNHPNIVTLLDAAQENGQHYLVMELVEGGSLDDLLQQVGRLPVPQMLNIALDLADALTRAHRLNIIHRDIKPANVLIAKDGTPRLTDFGIARVTSSNITETGTVVGTAAYIAPEVLHGSPADARSDIWSLGIMLIEMLTGSHPFKAAHPAGLIYAILCTPITDLEALCPDAPLALIDLINRMVIKNPTERIPRMRLVGAELEAILSGEGSTVVRHEDTVTPHSVEAPTSRFATPSPVAINVVRHNLPVQTTPFVGREHELIELEKLVQDPVVRLITILGPGGMGKTRLSLEAAKQITQQEQGLTLFEHGIFFVDLAPLGSPENILQAVGEALGYAFQDDRRGAKQQILDYVQEKRLLLLMDNFEQVVAGRTLVQELLQAAPQIKIVATSREKLNLSGETVFILGGMDFPDWETPEDALNYGAVKLFMQSARRVRADFQLQTGDLTYVARICRMVHGMPLGILLAAAWLEALSPQDIAQEISRSLDFLETQMHDLPERQRSLRAVFEYSWNLLTDQERRLFAQCSVFRGGFTREAAQQITGSNLRTLAVMINKSLLRRDNSLGRYDVHELLRQYAEAKLNESVEMASIHMAHSNYYLNLLVQLTPRLKGHGQLEALNTIETEFENIRAAWLWAVQQHDAEHIRQALEGLYLFLTLRNRFMDGQQLFQAARQAWPAEGDKPLLLAGQVLVRYPESASLPAFRRGLTIAEQWGDAFEIAFCQRLIGHWLSHTDYDHAEGVPLMEASLQGFEALGDKFYIAQVLDDMGWSHNMMMNQGVQQTLVQRSLDLRRDLGDKIGTANSLRNLGGSQGGTFDATDTAVNYWQEAKEIAYSMNDRLGVAWNAGLQAINLLLRGQFDRTQTLIDEGYPHAADINDPVVKGFIWAIQGSLIALRDEDYARAKTILEDAYPAGSPPDFRLTTVPFGMILVACGLRDRSIFKTSMTLLRETELFNRHEFYIPIVIPYHLIALSQEGQYSRAAALMRAYFEVTVSYIGLPFPMAWARQWGLLIRLRAELETALGPEAFQAAWKQGTALTMADLVVELEQFVAGIL